MGLGMFFVVVLFAGILLSIEAGWRTGARQVQQGKNPTHSAIEGGVLALLGLILAFSFSAAAGRLESRRSLVTNEANAIGTALLRVDLMPEADRAPLGQLLREFAQSRIDYNSALADGVDPAAALNKTNVLQGRIWDLVTKSELNDSGKLLVIPAINEAFDSASSRTVASQVHLPAILNALLIVLALLSAFLIGHATSNLPHRSWTHWIIFAAMVSATVYVIADMDRPRSGTIRVGPADDLLRSLTTPS